MGFTMCRLRISRQSLLPSLLALLVCVSLLFSTIAFGRPLQVSGGNGQQQARGSRPETGPPAPDLPDLDEVRHRRHSEPQALAPIESTMRKHRKPRVPRNGLKVGDPIPAGFSVGQVNTGQIGGGAESKQTATMGTRNLKALARDKRAQNRATGRLNHARSTTPVPMPTGINDDWYVG